MDSRKSASIIFIALYSWKFVFREEIRGKCENIWLKSKIKKHQRIFVKQKKLINKTANLRDQIKRLKKFLSWDVNREKLKKRNQHLIVPVKMKTNGHDNLR